MRIRFFDGSSKDGGVVSGDGMVLKLPITHYFRLWMGCGRGTNTRSELLALCGLLYFFHLKNILCMMVAGDSKVILDWAQHKCNL